MRPCPWFLRGGGHAHFLDWPGGNAGVVFDLGSATWMVDAEGAALRRITDADPERAGSWPIGQYGYYADVSPDGSRVVYSTCEYTTFDHDMRLGWRYNLGYEIASVSVDGSGRQRLTDNVHFENYPTWSPDGTRIAFIAHNGYSRLADYDYYLRPDHYHVSNSEVFTRSADGSDERVVPNTRGAGLYPAVWSPDGQRLAFTAHEVPPPFHGASARLERFLYTVRLDGSELSRVGKATTLPTWSPDGEWVAYGLEDRVYSVRFDGTDLLEVLDDFRANEVSWSPDGTELLLASDRGVYVVRPDGSGKRAVGPRIRTTAATWSPGGSMIAARHEPDGGHLLRPWIFVIFIMNRDGTDVRVLARGFLEGDGYSVHPKDCPNQAAAHRSRDVFEWRGSCAAGGHARSGGGLQGTDSVSGCVRSACGIRLDDGYADGEVAGSCRRWGPAACAGAADPVQRRDRHDTAGYRQADDAGVVGPLQQQSADRCDTT